MQRARYSVTSLGDRHSLVKLSDRVCVIVQALKRSGKAGRRARLVAGYIGCDTQSEAIALVRGLKSYLPKAFCEVRSSQRIDGYPVEIKIRYSFDESLETLLWSFAANPKIIAGAVNGLQPRRPSIEAIAPLEPLAPVRAIEAVEFAPVQHRSYRAKTVNGFAIE